MANMSLDEGCARDFGRELEEVRSHVLAMGGIVEEQIARAVDALVGRDSALGEGVAGRDEEVDRMEVSISEECSRMLSLPQRSPGDLRLLIAVIRTTTDLEHIGDEARKLGVLACRLASVDVPPVSYRAVGRMAASARYFVHEALNAFARMDCAAARELTRRDHELDARHAALIRQLIALNSQDLLAISQALDLLWTAAALARIGGHAKHLCEYVADLESDEVVRKAGKYH